ncbi:MAG: N-6 DNA methylase [Desulfobacteraceae bacterium]|nr:N-6 DNA methylase [Desulfobacteraceae bacterium]
MKLQNILKDSNYKLTQFKQPLPDDLEKQVIEKKIGQKISYKVECLIRGKEIRLTPEEIVRQLYLRILTQEYNYSTDRIQLEYQVSFGVEKKRADIVIMDKDRPDVPYIIVELKKPKLKDGKEQLKSYCNATGAPMGVWTNGEQISYYHRKDPNYFEDIPHIPHAYQKLSDLLTERWTIADLISNDKLLKERKSLKDLILEMEDEVLANAGVDVFEELFKLIFTKLYDEMESGRNTKRQLEFRNYGDTEFELKTKIQKLFEKARNRWGGVFADNTKIELTPSHLSVCVSSLQDVKLFNSNLDVVDEAFEYLINKTSKGEKGQYFTPRYVIDMCVKMLNPKEDETMIDTAAGSCGFPVHTTFHVWKQILTDEGIPQSHLFTSEKKPVRCEDYVREKVFAIDFDEKAVRVGRTLNLIAGDGQTNVLHLNTLDYERWYERIEKDTAWIDTYYEGWKRFRRMRNSKDNRSFQFDVLMANPPFAGDIKETRILTKYDLAKSVLYSKIKGEGIRNFWDYSDNNPKFPEFLGIKGEQIIKMADGTFKKVKLKQAYKMGRDILFIERNLDFLKPGGRMAVVLPQGRFNNSSDINIREYIADRCRILAVVGLHGNVFKPHTGTKTSVLFLQKWTDDNGICPRKKDYPIFFATMQEPSKDNSGDKIYVKQSDDMSLLDEHGHLIVRHDLFNHDGLTQDGIAEAFIEFAKKEKLSFFFDYSTFDEMKYCDLLEELEASEVLLSYILTNNEIFRFDSNYFQKEFLKDEYLIRNKRYDKLKNLSTDIKSFGAYSLNNQVEYTEEGIPFIRGVDMKNGTVNFDNIIYINEMAHKLLWKSEIKPEMVLLSMSGTIGDVAIASKNWKYPVNSSQDIAKIDTNWLINPYFLYSFLLSKFGQNYLKREARGSVQQHVFLSQIEQLEIPISDISFVLQTENIVKLAHSKLEESKITYAAAENLLLEALDLKNFQPSHKNFNIKSFKDSFLNSGRLDSEYYQLKYEDFFNSLLYNAKIKNWKINRIEGISAPLKYGSSTKLKYIEDGVPFLRIADLTGNVFEPKSLKYVSVQDALLEKSATVKTNDVLISRSGTLGLSVIIPEFLNDSIYGSYFIRARPNQQKINPRYLTLYLNSMAGKIQVEQANTGGVQTNLTIPVIENLKIITPPFEIQNQIVEKVQESLRLRQQSDHLLEIAKQAVETAIEKGESEAEKLLTLHAQQ